MMACLFTNHREQNATTHATAGVQAHRPTIPSHVQQRLGGLCFKAAAGHSLPHAMSASAHPNAATPLPTVLPAATPTKHLALNHFGARQHTVLAYFAAHPAVQHLDAATEYAPLRTRRRMSAIVTGTCVALPTNTQCHLGQVWSACQTIPLRQSASIGGPL